MSSIQDRLKADLVAAMKARETDKVAVLRLVQAALRNAEIEKGARDEGLEDSQTIKVLGTMAKQRRDSIEQFQKGGRDDLVQKEQFELDQIESYLPEPLSESEVDKLIAEVISELSAESMADMGKVMRVVSERSAGRADGKALSAKVRGQLAK